MQRQGGREFRHLKRVLKSCFQHYPSWRVHRSLDMDSPDARPVQPPELGEVVDFPETSGDFSITTSGEPPNRRGTPPRGIALSSHRAASLSLTEVAELVRVSTGRMSQLQRAVEEIRPDVVLARFLCDFKLKH